MSLTVLAACVELATAVQHMAADVVSLSVMLRKDGGLMYVSSWIAE
jgi:hypothetical protein